MNRKQTNEKKQSDQNNLKLKVWNYLGQTKNNKLDYVTEDINASSQEVV